jgi:hypothetical protein
MWDIPQSNGISQHRVKVVGVWDIPQFMEIDGIAHEAMNRHVGYPKK